MRAFVFFYTVNLLNLVDAIQTYVCTTRCSFCIEANPLMRSPIALYAKIVIVWAWSLVLYKASWSENKLIAKTAEAMLILLAFILLVAVINNTLVLLNARC